ncbi:fimbrial protein [Proteus myxofaciens]|uniref:Fimbrial-type adhesion domain-containing protein n=1 Tax=Proteus myxofaciens ATCC 19692 TaxID=1354337 RepID=A0A198GMH6_9GAMM|nr:fimbrial protein [Proteus myxofaciens]OAT38672.1 hypothetical protein M983_0216 [Proteus myxofaciens ATCC 19692]
MNKAAKYGWLLPVIFWGDLSQVQAANSLDVEFSGELVTTACQVSADSLNQKITLYNLRWQSINETGVSDVTPFSIDIDKCSEVDLQKIIKLTWQSNDLVNIGSDTFLTTKGESGVLLGLVDNNNTPLIWNQPMTIGDVNVVEGLQQFDFGVFVRKPATGDANTGDFSGIVTFNVEYE